MNNAITDLLIGWEGLESGSKITALILYSLMLLRYHYPLYHIVAIAAIAVSRYDAAVAFK